MGTIQSSNQTDDLNRQESDEECLYQSDQLSAPTEDDTKKALQSSKQMKDRDQQYSDQHPSSIQDDVAPQSHDYNIKDPLSQEEEEPEAVTNTKSSVSDSPSSQADFSECQSSLTIEDICLEECAYLNNTDSPLVENCKPIVVEPGDEDDNFISSSQDSDRLSYLSPRNNVQVTNLIDELIQKALLDGKKSDENEPLTAATEPPKKKKYYSNKKQKTKVTKSARDSDVKRGDAGDGMFKTSVQAESVCVSSNINPAARPIAWEVDCTDFAAPKVKPKKSSAAADPKKYRSKASKWMIAQEGAQEYIPPEVKATADEMAHRKMLDHRRWLCISRPQYSKSCGLSSLVGCWNYLFSTLGVGNHQPINQEQAMTVLGFKPPFAEIRFGPFTGNATLMRWFQQLNNHYGVRGRAYFLYKPHGKNRTMGRSSDEALGLLKKGLRDETMTFIYHCWNHYFCPIGYEDVPLRAVDAYRGGLTQDEVETWILIGDSSRKHPGMHCFKWSDISTDLNCQMPEYLNIRKLHLGVQKRKTKKGGGNLHCIMVFQKSQWQGMNSTKSSKKGVKSAKETRQPRGKKGGKRVKSATQETDDRNMGVKFGRDVQSEKKLRWTMNENKHPVRSDEAACLAQAVTGRTVQESQTSVLSNACVTSRYDMVVTPSGDESGVRVRLEKDNYTIASSDCSDEDDDEESELSDEE